MARGIPLVGVDIAPRMLRRLVANAGHGPAPARCVGDVTALPRRSGGFGAVVASHVLHLVVDWRTTVDEAVRVLGPGGVLLVDFGGVPAAPWHETTSVVRRDHGVVRMRSGISDPRPVAEYLSGRATVRPLAPLTMVVEGSLAQDLEDWEGQRHSWTWSFSPAQVATGVAAVRRWASDTGWPLARRVELERTVRWWAFDTVAAP